MSKVVGVCGAIGAGKGEVAKRIAEALDLPEFAYAQGVKTIAHSIGQASKPPSRESKEESQTFFCSVRGIIKGIRQVFPEKPSDWHVEKAAILMGLLQENLSFKWVRLKEGVEFTLVTSYRVLYQTVGTDWGRKYIHPDVWIQRRPEECVVNDVRAFANAPDPYAEAKAIIADGGVVLRVVRDSAEAQDYTNGHVSESPMDPQYVFCDVDNNGTLEDLDETVDAIAEQLIEHFSPKPKVQDEKADKPRKGRTAKEPEVPDSEGTGS